MTLSRWRNWHRFPFLQFQNLSPSCAIRQGFCYALEMEICDGVFGPQSKVLRSFISGMVSVFVWYISGQKLCRKRAKATVALALFVSNFD